MGPVPVLLTVKTKVQKNLTTPFTTWVLCHSSYQGWGARRGVPFTQTGTHSDAGVAREVGVHLQR